VAERAGAKRAVLVPRARDFDWALMTGVQTLGLSAGASAPESLVQEMIDQLAQHFRLTIEERRVTEEDVIFKLPAPLQDVQAA